MSFNHTRSRNSFPASTSVSLVLPVGVTLSPLLSNALFSLLCFFHFCFASTSLCSVFLFTLFFVSFPFFAFPIFTNKNRFQFSAPFSSSLAYLISLSLSLLLLSPFSRPELFVVSMLFLCIFISIFSSFVSFFSFVNICPVWFPRIQVTNGKEKEKNGVVEIKKRKKQIEKFLKVLIP